MDLTLLLPLVAIAFLVFWMIRSNNKRNTDQRQMMDAIKPGQRVMLTSGMFGTIRAVGEQQMVVELAPGMDVTVVKAAVAKTLAPADEEFEYSDELEGETPREIEAGSAEPGASADAKARDVTIVEPEVGGDEVEPEPEATATGDESDVAADTKPKTTKTKK